MLAGLEDGADASVAVVGAVDAGVGVGVGAPDACWSFAAMCQLLAQLESRCWPVGGVKLPFNGPGIYRTWSRLGKCRPRAAFNLACSFWICEYPSSVAVQLFV